MLTRGFERPWWMRRQGGACRRMSLLCGMTAMMLAMILVLASTVVTAESPKKPLSSTATFAQRDEVLENKTPGVGDLPLNNVNVEKNPQVLVLSTLDGNVIGLDARTGAAVFQLDAQSDTPAVTSWAAPGQPQYIPGLNGALYRIDPDSQRAEPVDDTFLISEAESHVEAAEAVVAEAEKAYPGMRRAHLQSKSGRKAIVLKHQHTVVTYIDISTGETIKSVDFNTPGSIQDSSPILTAERPGNVDDDHCEAVGHAQGNNPEDGGDSGKKDELSGMEPGKVILLSRTVVGVRVLDAWTGAELANASLTHTTPSLLQGGLCVAAASLDSSDADGGHLGSLKGYQSLIESDTGRVRMIEPGSNGAVLWSIQVDVDILDAHGIGDVYVRKTSRRHSLPPGPDRDRLADLDNVPVRAIGDDSTAAGALRIRGRGSARYAMLSDGSENIHDYPDDGDQYTDGSTSRGRFGRAPIFDDEVDDDVEDDEDPLHDMTTDDEHGSEPVGVFGFLRAALFRWERLRLLAVTLGIDVDEHGFRDSSANDGLLGAFRRGRSEYADELAPEINSIYLLMALSLGTGIAVGVVGIIFTRGMRLRHAQILKMLEEADSQPATPISSAGPQSEGSLPKPGVHSLGQEASSGSTTSNSAVPTRSQSGWLSVGALHVSSIVLGYGSHGTVVYEGRMMPGERKVAVKRLLRQFYESARKEISLLVELDEASPHVVRYYAMEEDAEFIYLALELCAGSLGDRIASRLVPVPSMSYTHGPIPQSTGRALRQLMKGLADLHKQNIVHRDLKPQNVLIARASGGAVDIKLADVGLALRLAADRSSYTAVSNAAGGIGTTGWRAPEVLSGGRQTKAVDIFAAGCIVAVVVTGGQHPFGEVVFGRDGRIATGKPDLSALTALQLPEAVDAVSRMIAHDPALRPSATEALAHPLFWTDALKLAFLVDISDRLYDLRNEATRYTELLNDSPMALEHCGKWKSRMDAELIDEVGRGYAETTSNLLRLVRNKRNHYSELSSRLQKTLGPLPSEDETPENSNGDGHARTQAGYDGHIVDPSEISSDSHNFLRYFLRRVPYLFMCVYNHAKRYPALVHQPHFVRYGFQHFDVPTLPLHPLVARRRMQHPTTEAELLPVAQEPDDKYIHSASDAGDRRIYHRQFLIQLGAMPGANDEAMRRTLAEYGILQADAAELWQRRLATGVYEVAHRDDDDDTDDRADDESDIDTQGDAVMSPPPPSLLRSPKDMALRQDVRMEHAAGIPRISLTSAPMPIPSAGTSTTTARSVPSTPSVRPLNNPRSFEAPDHFGRLGPGAIGALHPGSVPTDSPLLRPQHRRDTGPGGLTTTRAPTRVTFEDGRDAPRNTEQRAGAGFAGGNAGTSEDRRPGNQWKRKPALGFTAPGEKDTRDWGGLRR